MSTTHGAQPGSTTSGDETQVNPRVRPDGGEDRGSGRPSEGAPAQDAPAEGGGAKGAADGADQRSTAEKMRDGAMARTAQGRDLAARKARALRGATAGLASGSAAGATAGRAGTQRQPAAPGAGTARTTGNTRPGAARTSRPAPRRTGPRRVRLTAQRIDPWSVLKISFL